MGIFHWIPVISGHSSPIPVESGPILEVFTLPPLIRAESEDSLSSPQSPSGLSSDC